MGIPVSTPLDRHYHPNPHQNWMEVVGQICTEIYNVNVSESLQVVLVE